MAETEMKPEWARPLGPGKGGAVPGAVRGAGFPIPRRGSHDSCWAGRGGVAT